MLWNTPSFPVKPRGTPKLRVVEGARLTRVQKGRLRVLRRPDRWITGAVHDSKGRLVPISQKIGGLGGHRMAMADPLRIELERRVPRLRGRWLYGGHWMMHFGHFLTETVTTLWPEDLEPIRGLVFHRYLSPNPIVHTWQQRLVDLAGHQGVPIHIVNERQVRVDELVVPSRSIVQHGWGDPGATAVWQRIAAAVPEQDPPWSAAGWPSRVYMSRASFNAGVRARGRKDARSTPECDALLDAVFAEAGFEVIAPEKLSIDDQVRLLRSTRVLAGQNGSALHLAGFARPGARVLELGDRHRPNRGVLTQRVINTLCGHSEAFVPDGLGREELVEGLHELGVWQSDPLVGELPG
jgi:capsular polysaccharide biosynthesis protein